MVTFREFVSIFGDECGGGANDAAPVWNANKASLEAMSERDVRDRLECP